MARKKMNDNEERLPTLQIPVTKEFKADVEDLALSFGYRKVSEFLLPLIKDFVEVNQDRLKRYRNFISEPAQKPPMKAQVKDNGEE